MGTFHRAHTTAGIVVSFILMTGLAHSAPLTKVASSDCVNPNIPHEILDGTTNLAGSAHMHLTRADTATGTLHLAVAGTESDRDAGLGCVASLHPHSGMVFVFDELRKWDFWQHDARVALDYVWLDENGRVTQIQHSVAVDKNTKPGSGYTHQSGIGRYVLLLESGEAAANRIAVDSIVAIPDLYKNAPNAPKPHSVSDIVTPTPTMTMAPTIPTPSVTVPPTQTPTPVKTAVPTQPPTPQLTAVPTAKPTIKPAVEPPKMQIPAQNPVQTTSEPLKSISPPATPPPEPVISIHPSMTQTQKPMNSETPRSSVPMATLPPTMSHNPPATITVQKSGSVTHINVKNNKPSMHQHVKHPVPRPIKTSQPHAGHELFPIQDHFEIKVDR